VISSGAVYRHAAVRCAAAILLGLGELRLDLLDLVFIRTAVELEYWLILLYRHVVFDQHGGDQGRLGQARNELDSALHDGRVGGVWGHESQADKKYQEQVDHKNGREESPSGVQPQQLEFEEDKPEDDAEDDED